MTGRHPFTARDDDSREPVEIVAYVYGQRGADDGQVSHAYLVGAARYVRAFFTDDGRIAGAALGQTLVALATNGHAFTVTPRVVHIHGGTVAWHAAHGAPPSPDEIESAWFDEAEARRRELAELLAEGDDE